MADRLAAIQQIACSLSAVPLCRCVASYVWFRVGLVDLLDLVGRGGGEAAVAAALPEPVPVAGRQPELVPGVSYSRRTN